MNKKYLGDGVYADVENGMLKLTVENGISVTDEIYLEYEVYLALVAFMDNCRPGGVSDE